MLFSSLEFLFLFLPFCLGIYYAIPRIWGMRNYWLLAMSLLFYAWSEPQFVFVMIGSIAFNYFVALFLSALSDGIWRKILLWLAIVGNLAIIGTWKYANFVTENLRELFPSWNGVVPQTSFILPIGISFFTFQAMSYVVDVYRKTVRVQRNPFYLALYIALFPQLIAGPIVRYNTVAEQIEWRRETLAMFASGIKRFLIGFNKKMLLANLLAVTADRFFAMKGVSVCGAWLGAIAYTFQIFFDFSGYSDMAIGLGRMFGFEFLENFNYPYISCSITEFWRRWHMSLGTWFRDYLYFPMGGSRVVSKARLVLNLSVVWLATGVWHGANWTFILWGALYGVLIIVEKLTNFPKRMDACGRLRWLGLLPTLFFVILGWVLFRSADIASAVVYLKAMFGVGASGFYDYAAVFEFLELKVLLPAAVLASIPWLPKLMCAVSVRIPHAVMPLKTFGILCSVMLFLASISFLIMNAHNPFIYFNF